MVEARQLRLPGIEASGTRYMQIRHPGLARYREEGFDQVQGWCSERLFPVLDMLADCRINKKGGVAEIGIHHGKLFLLLNQLTGAEDRSFAIDLFGNQALNIDRSGRGNLAIFQQNLKAFDAHRGENTRIVSGDSSDTALDLVGTIGRGTLRFFSVDGGHTVEHLLNDLAIAEQTIANEGVVIVDDIFHIEWPGVTEGIVRYMLPRPALVPVAIGHGKLYMCKMSFHGFYLGLFEQLPGKARRVNFCGWPTMALPEGGGRL